MEERVEAQRLARAEHDLERAMVDEVMRAIHAEDRMAVELKHRKAAETVEYIHAFVRDRDARREAQRQAEWAEDRKIQVRGRDQPALWFFGAALVVLGVLCSGGTSACTRFVLRTWHRARACTALCLLYRGAVVGRGGRGPEGPGALGTVCQRRCCALCTVSRRRCCTLHV